MLTLKLLVAFLACALVFHYLEKRKDGSTPALWARSNFLTDLTYWFVTPLATTLMLELTISGSLTVAILVIGENITGSISFSAGLLEGQPLGVQIIIGLMLGDGLYYAMHRLFHCRWLWNFHAVHHSSRAVNWLSAVRLHPVNNYLMRLSQAVLALLLGVDPQVLAVVVAFLYLYAVFIHADLDWDYGVFRYVFVSPVYHRWHHTQEEAGLDKNYSGLFPFWDILFGSCYLPRDRKPHNFGTRSPVPETFLPQMLYPFVPKRYQSCSGASDA